MDTYRGPTPVGTLVHRRLGPCATHEENPSTRLGSEFSPKMGDARHLAGALPWLERRQRVPVSSIHHARSSEDPPSTSANPLFAALNCRCDSGVG